MTVAEAATLPFRTSFLEKTYSPGNASEAMVQVRELSWKRRRTYVTVWFHSVGGQWVAINGVEWHRRMLHRAELEPPPVQGK
jgi:hypothetical protein